MNKAKENYNKTTVVFKMGGRQCLKYIEELEKQNEKMEKLLKEVLEYACQVDDCWKNDIDEEMIKSIKEVLKNE